MINPKCVCGAVATMSAHGSGMAHTLCGDCASRVLKHAMAVGHTVRIAPYVMRAPPVRGVIPRRVK